MTNNNERQEYIIELKQEIRKQEHMISYLREGKDVADKNVQEMFEGSKYTSYIKTVGSNKFRVDTNWCFDLHCFVTTIWNVTEQKEYVNNPCALCFLKEDRNFFAAAERHQNTVEALKSGWSLWTSDTDLNEEVIRKDYVTTANNNSLVVITSKVDVPSGQFVDYWTRCYFSNEEGDAFVCKPLGFSHIGMTGYEEFTPYYEKWVNNHEQVLAEVRKDF